MDHRLHFNKEQIRAVFIDTSGRPAEKIIEIRTNPVTLRSCRITYSRIEEKEMGTEMLPDPPPFAFDTATCPFCSPQVSEMTPKFLSENFSSERLVIGESVLFPNLFPYGSYSAVSLFDQNHFVEIGRASLTSYINSFKNSIRYFGQILQQDATAIHMAITQNHLPSAGGSLLHPHLQLNAERISGNYHRYLNKRSRQYYKEEGELIFSNYLDHEIKAGKRYIGTTGNWHWMTAFAPEGFYEIWGILPGVTSFQSMSDKEIKDLCIGVLNTQKFYRSLNRNGYNLGILSIEKDDSCLELRVVMVVRSNYAQWVRNDHTGFEVMVGDMATFVAPEKTASLAGPFWRAH
jgi:galactose-1-phosphate uridylyltransferase